MSRLIPPPPPTVPLGHVIGNKVFIDNAWALYLTKGLIERLGGYEAPTITEISTRSAPMLFGEDSGDDGGMMFVPVQGQSGRDGVTTVIGLLDNEDRSDPPPLFPGWVANAPILESGTYTPTLTNVANLDASTAYECQYLRVGNVVHVGGRVDVDPTGAGASTQLGISLPIASNFAASSDCGGTGFSPGVAGQGAAVVPDAANNRAQLQFVSGATLSNQSMYFTFTYEVV